MLLGHAMGCFKYANTSLCQVTSQAFSKAATSLMVPDNATPTRILVSSLTRIVVSSLLEKDIDTIGLGGAIPNIPYGQSKTNNLKTNHKTSCILKKCVKHNNTQTQLQKLARAPFR